ncbi:hypothetical protein C8034_v004155 [Colletotrichum sidae]|uniref:Uncharacterized protein n=2 Tax=Colletotrichum orbiculare species complex TaxID=2707354 RepID=A0A4R8QDM7_COLTR|nr:hypothetical protein CTRI78_v011639 [Colletotrichum trifolii]TEA13534.1 hypothetical protein C8034_v004155 [Colletotrichum sidae]
MRLSSILSTSALAAPALAIAGVPCAETTVTGDAITGFRFSGYWCTWEWWSRDKFTQVKLQEDCVLRQTWPNVRPLKKVCIRQKFGGGDKCFVAPDLVALGACDIPGGWCTNVENMWGWE